MNWPPCFRASSGPIGMPHHILHFWKPFFNYSLFFRYIVPFNNTAYACRNLRVAVIYQKACRRHNRQYSNWEFPNFLWTKNCVESLSKPMSVWEFQNTCLSDILFSIPIFVYKKHLVLTNGASPVISLIKKCKII